MNIKGSKALLEELKKGQGDSNCLGYWISRAMVVDYPTTEDWLDLPYVEFHDNNSEAGAKKNLTSSAICMANENPKKFEGFYEGTLLTQRIAVAQGFFLYSAAIVNMHLAIAEASRQFGCKATYAEVLEHAKNKDGTVYKNLFLCNMSLEICARLHYEGKGSLGGYSPNVWLFWGRLFGIGCPTDSVLLSPEQAGTHAANYRKASKETKGILFHTWYMEAFKDEFKPNELGSKLLPSCIALIHGYYEMVQTYNSFESKRMKYKDIDKKGDEDFFLVLKALLAGMFRRTSKGIMESARLEYNEAEHLTGALQEYLDIYVEWFKDGTGQLTAFGATLLRACLICNKRVSLINQINKRDDMPEQTRQNFLKQGMQIKATKLRG